MTVEQLGYVMLDEPDVAEIGHAPFRKATIGDGRAIGDQDVVMSTIAMN